METNLRCPYCGAKLPEGSLYCYKCGTKLNLENDVNDLDHTFHNTDNAQDENIPIDDLLGQTHVINSLMSELDEIVKDSGGPIPVTPSVKAVHDEEDTPITPSRSRVQETPSNPKEDTDPFAWEIPAFNPNDNKPSSIHREEISSHDIPELEPALKEEFDTAPRPLSRAARHSRYQTDPYLNETGATPTEEEEHTVPPQKKEPPVKEKKKKNFFFEEDEDDDDYDGDDDYYDDDDDSHERHVWPIVVGTICMVMIAAGAFLVIFKPDIINSGIDGINKVFHTEIKHLGATPVPEETIVPTTTPLATIDTTQYDSEHPYFSFAAVHYASFYRDYIDVYNSGDIQSLGHVTDTLKAEIQDRYTRYNSDLGFESMYMYIDLDSYQVSELQSDGYYDISFNTYQENKCWQKSDNTPVDNNPTMSVVMRYNPETGDYYLSTMTIANDVVLGNRLVDITYWQ